QFLASQLVQTNTLLDSQTTNTHPSPQPTQGHVHWGHPHQISPPHNPNRTEPVFVLVKAGRNPVLRTMFPAGQRDITLDQTRSAVQLQPGPHACDNRHRHRPATTPTRTPPSHPRATNHKHRPNPPPTTAQLRSPRSSPAHGLPAHRSA